MPAVAQPDQCFYDGATSYVYGSQRLRTRGLPSRQDHRGEGAAFTVGQSPPNAVERLVKLLFDGLQRVAESTLVGARAAAGSLPNEVGEQHRALGMAPGDIEQRAQCVARVAAGALEPGSDELREVLARQWGERHSARLTVERALPVVEQGTHHAGMGAGEEVSGLVVVLFDHAADRPVERGTRREHLLEVVEADQHSLTAPLEQLRWQLEQFEQGCLCGRSRGRAAERQRAEGRRDRYAHRGELAPHPTREGTAQLAVAALEPRDRLLDRQDPVEVDVDGRAALTLRLGADLVYEGRLPVSARGRQAGVVAAAKQREESVDLVPTIDELVRRHGLCIDEGGVHAVHDGRRSYR